MKEVINQRVDNNEAKANAPESKKPKRLIFEYDFHDWRLNFARVF